MPFIAGAFLLIAAAMLLEGQEGTRTRASDPPSVASNDYGRVIKFDLEAAPFPDAARREGYSYAGDFYPSDGHYDDPSVVVFIPSGYSPEGKVDLVFFFHGWYSSVPKAASDFDLFRQFSTSGAKALLVMPETARDAPDSFAGKLERDDGFNALVGQLLEALHAGGVTPRLEAGNIILAGHSGAYHIISRILSQRGAAAKVGEVCLFDALYDDVERFAEWIQEGKGSFVSICSDGGDPADNARGMAEALQARGIPVVTAKDDPEDNGRSLRHRVVFLLSQYDHSGIISQADEFRRVLAASMPSR